MTEQTTLKQIHVSATLDVESVEHELDELWKEQAGSGEHDEEGATMRARVLNLLVYVPAMNEANEVSETLAQVTMAHPCRALVAVAEEREADLDIEMFVSAHCRPSSAAGGRQLCCEQVTLAARGRFTVELPSAATPLLIPDLTTFLWWRDDFRPEDPVFKGLSRAATRLLIDSALSPDPLDDLRSLARSFKGGRPARPGVSDFNWSRLTSWRGLLANFYDVREYREALDRLTRVRVEYAAGLTGAPDSIAPQALMIAGWLASCLKWEVREKAPARAAGGAAHTSREVVIEKGG
ncbi:MAG TPA: glucose-6-phosphate dehydrogenase assembly protein OpcA, partial [Pyrinomonadaceae bacterium]